MTAFDFFCYGHGVFFTALQTLLMFGIFLEWLRDRRALKAPAGRKTGGGVPEARVSLVIPIHNEGRRMGGLLESLLLQDFPAEIIFVDDRSTDESPAMLEKFVKDAAERGMNDCRIITLAENPGPNFKQHALSAGIAEARGDYFLFTDGDCDVPPGWIRAMARRISGDRICGGRINGEPGGEAVGAVIGPVFKKKRGKGFFSLYQCYDHAVRYNYLAGAIGLGAAGGGFGNNLIVSRAA
ncbi:MAG: glycosyltransferase, partial [Treponema sp.]|nr:glycosyltransferase [Treponema sp.]